MTDAPTELETFLRLSDEVSLACARVSEEDLLVLLPLLRNRLTVDLTGEMGADRAAAAAEALTATIFRRRQEILAPVLH
jgi:hypothetical protein